MMTDHPTPTDEASSSAIPFQVDETNLSAKVWFLSDGLSPIALGLTRAILPKGDLVVVGIIPEEFKSSRGNGLRALLDEVENEDGVNQEEEQDESAGDESKNAPNDRIKIVEMDARYYLIVSTHTSR
jgi:hypothetical protein